MVKRNEMNAINADRTRVPFLQLHNQHYNLIFTPTFLATLVLKYVKSKSVNVVVESKNKDDEKIIFLSNSVILAFE